MTEHYDTLIIGTGAGGAACALCLAEAGKRVLLLEKGEALPSDGSTLDVTAVFREGRFKSRETWVGPDGQMFVPDAFHNIGGKTKWYGAALLRFSPHEFEADPAHDCLAWPFGYDELAPWYDEAERLLGVRTFPHEPELKRLIARIENNSGWRSQPLPLGLDPAILDHPDEARHFDGFASPGNFKADAESALLARALAHPNVTLETGCEVAALLPGETSTCIGGVATRRGNWFASQVVLAAGALNSPRLLQDYLDRHRLPERLPSAPLVGAHYKMHLNSALVVFGLARRHDLLRKTAIFSHEAYPHSTIQNLGWLDGELLAPQLPRFLPRALVDALGVRAVGFFATTEDGSQPANRVISGTRRDGMPQLDYDPRRLPAAHAEHRALIRAFLARLRRAGLVGGSKWMGLAGTAHALGTLTAGDDPARSVVDPQGRVHGFTNLHVADGSVLPRASRVNPALTIYAWGLRLGQHLAELPTP